MEHMPTKVFFVENLMIRRVLLFSGFWNKTKFKKISFTNAFIYYKKIASDFKQQLYKI